MRPATKRAIEVARKQRARASRRATRRTRWNRVADAAYITLLVLGLLLAVTAPMAPAVFDAYYRRQERQVFEQEKAVGGCNPYTGYCGPEAFDEEWENQQP